MFYTKEYLLTRVESLKEERDNVKRIIWCEDFECNEYEHITLQFLSRHLADVDRMIDTYTQVLKHQYEVEL